MNPIIGTVICKKNYDYETMFNGIMHFEKSKIYAIYDIEGDEEYIGDVKYEYIDIEDYYGLWFGVNCNHIKDEYFYTKEELRQLKIESL